MIRRPATRMILGLAFAALLAAGAAQAQPPVWTVRDADSEMLLFGSVHVLPPGLAWKPAALVRAMQTADDLWFELPVDPASNDEAGRLAARAGVLPPGETLSALLKPADRARLARVAAQYGASLPLLDRLQPWLAEVALAEAAYRRDGGRTEHGVEQSLAADLGPAVQRRAFETVAEQIALFSGAPRPEQIASLRQTLMEMEARPSQFAALVQAWMSGDTAAIDREALAPLKRASPVVFKRFLTDRNARWMPVLRQRLAGSGRTVVVVGVGHLVGKEGLPAQLRALGYSVEGP